MGWCDDPKSKYYNKMIYFPFTQNAERLWLKDNIYDIIIVIDYNLRPVIKYAGSAIFIHIAKKNYLPTKGCVVLSKQNIKLLASNIDKNTRLKIY